MNCYLHKHGSGFLPGDEESQAVQRRLAIGEAIQVRFLKTRDLRSHRRYWKLVDLCAQNCERIEVQPNCWMDVKSKDDVHTAIKIITGLTETLFDADGAPVALLPKSTRFDEMTGDEWSAYWPRVLDAVQEKILPNVDLQSMVEEIERLMGYRNG